jgi:hypothetical protein
MFKERAVNPDVEPFAVVKARKIAVKSENGSLTGQIKDFFSLMGDVDYVSTADGMADHYVLCWFDDNEPDQTKDLRRLQGVTFSKAIYTLTESGKRTYNVAFKAEHGKLN